MPTKMLMICLNFRRHFKITISDWRKLIFTKLYKVVRHLRILIDQNDTPLEAIKRRVRIFLEMTMKENASRLKINEDAVSWCGSVLSSRAS